MDGWEPVGPGEKESHHPGGQQGSRRQTACILDSLLPRPTPESEVLLTQPESGRLACALLPHPHPSEAPRPYESCLSLPSESLVALCALFSALYLVSRSFHPPSEGQ